jgi:hypothetical protein
MFNKICCRDDVTPENANDTDVVSNCFSTLNVQMKIARLVNMRSVFCLRWSRYILMPVPQLVELS